MALIRQLILLCHLTLSTLRQRAATSVTLVVTMACVTGVLISMLSVTVGILREFGNAANPAIAVVMPQDARFDDSSGIPRNAVGTIANAPGIARNAQGKLLADSEVLLYVPPAEHIASGGELRIRGIGAVGPALRPHFAIVSGRMFRPGRQELIIGSRAEQGFSLRVGDTVVMRDGAWPIVGAFRADGVFADELLGDAETIATVTHMAGFGSVQVRLQAPTAFAAFKKWLTTNPALTVSAETQPSYFDRIASGSTGYFTAMAYLTGAILSAGALFGSMNILYGVVSRRAREMATLRAIGYGALPAASSVVFEALLLSLAGALVGGGVAWTLFNGHQIMLGENLYTLLVSPRLVAFGMGWALGLAVLGSLLPAIRVGRLPLTEALRVV